MTGDLRQGHRHLPASDRSSRGTREGAAVILHPDNPIMESGAEEADLHPIARKASTITSHAYSAVGTAEAPFPIHAA